MMKVKVKTHVRRLPGRQVPTPPWGADLRGGGRGAAKLAAPTATRWRQPAGLAPCGLPKTSKWGWPGPQQGGQGPKSRWPSVTSGRPDKADVGQQGGRDVILPATLREGQEEELHIQGDGGDVCVDVGQQLLPHLADPGALHEEVQGCLHLLWAGWTGGRGPQAAKTGQAAPDWQDVVDEAEGQVCLIWWPGPPPEPPPYQRPQEVGVTKLDLGDG